jgi:hypothetical protein
VVAPAADVNDGLAADPVVRCSVLGVRWSARDALDCALEDPEPSVRKPPVSSDRRVRIEPVSSRPGWLIRDEGAGGGGRRATSRVGFGGNGGSAIFAAPLFVEPAAPGPEVEVADVIARAPATVTGL